MGMTNDSVFSEVKGYASSIDEGKGLSIDELKRRISMRMLLERYGAELPAGDGWASMRCPFHLDNNPSSSVNLKDGKFRCHVCDVGGDIVDVVALQEGLTTREAMEWLRTNLL
jgi:DNA primase